MCQADVIWRGRMAYHDAASAMLSFTDERKDDTRDQIWILEHAPVYTQGTSCRTEPFDNPHDIPIVHSNRGGQLTYHGPGQLILYLLFDIKRMGIGPKKLVSGIEQSIINLLEDYGLSATRRQGAPGVYVDGAKIAALGLRIRNGKCFHGLSLNVDMDLEPFHYIDPCGIPGLAVTQLSDLGVRKLVTEAGADLVRQFWSHFGWGSPPKTIMDAQRYEE